MQKNNIKGKSKQNKRKKSFKSSIWLFTSNK